MLQCTAHAAHIPQEFKKYGVPNLFLSKNYETSNDIFEDTFNSEDIIISLIILR